MTTITRSGVATVLAALLATTQAAAWSGPAHQAIAHVAQDRLTLQTQKAIANIRQDTDVLAPGALTGTATWPDEVRSHARGQTPSSWTDKQVTEADRFNAAHRHNAEWHFVDLPLGAGEYPPSGTVPADNPLTPFIGPDDIVHALTRAIAILEAPTAPADFSKLQALKVLVHLVGDIHQPMHVTSSYDKVTLTSFKTRPVRIDDPVKASRSGVLNDRGGNGLQYSSSTNLHGLWDGCLGALGVSCKSTEFSAVALRLKPLVTSQAVSQFGGHGDHHGWPAAWATDSLGAAVKSDA